MMKTYKTLVETFMEHARRFPDTTIIKYKKEKGGPYVDVSWHELKALVVSFARGLMQLGIRPGDRVAILSYNRLEWIVADLGTMLVGGVDVPIYHTNTAEQCAYIIGDSGARFAVVEDTTQLAKIFEGGEGVGTLSGIILIKGEPPEGQEKVVSYRDLLDPAIHKDSRETFEEQIDGRTLDDLATIVYTSGTTGPPKGCMISHRNIAAVLDSIHQIFDIEPEANLSLMILPLSHLYPRVSGYYYNISANIPLAIGESLETLAQNMVEVRPTYFTSVPRIFEKVYDRIHHAAGKGSKLKRALFNWAVQVGRARSRTVLAHESVSPFLAVKFRVADALVFGKIRNVLGGRLCFAVSAGAPLSAEVGEFIHSMGIQVFEFYALTETISGTMTTSEHCRFGTVGKPMPGTEVKLEPDGEILIRGNNFMGYYNKPELTEEVPKDGWCHTGDVGRWDSDGFLVITDRKKDLIITSGGKNISPQNIENLLKRIPCVSIPMVYGDGRNYLTALLTLDRAETTALAEEKGIAYTTYGELVTSPEITRIVQEGIDTINAGLARFETIKKFVIVPEEFSQEAGEITPTLKLRRKEVIRTYGHLLEALYEDKS